MGDSTVILVTGASRGIGAAVVRLLLTTTKPLSLVTVSRSPAPSGPIVLPNGTVHALTHVRLDLGTPNGPNQAIKKAIEIYGKLDGLVVNHAVLSPVEKIASQNLDYLGSKDEETSASIQRWKAAFDVNFFSGVALVKAATPYLRRTAGKVVFVSSAASLNAYPALCSYCASKAALDAFCRNLALEEPMITCISLDPGMVDTGLHLEVKDELIEAMGVEFHEAHKDVKLLKPDQPGAVIANLVLKGTKQLSGGRYNWNADELMDYQGTIVSRL